MGMLFRGDKIVFRDNKVIFADEPNDCECCGDCGLLSGFSIINDDCNRICIINESVVPDGCNCTPTHFWDFGDGTTSTDENPCHAYIGCNKPYTVRHTITCGTSFNTSEQFANPSLLGCCCPDFCCGSPLAYLVELTHTIADDECPNCGDVPTSYIIDAAGCSGRYLQLLDCNDECGPGCTSAFQSEIGQVGFFDDCRMRLTMIAHCTGDNCNGVLAPSPVSAVFLSDILTDCAQGRMTLTRTLSNTGTLCSGEFVSAAITPIYV